MERRIHPKACTMQPARITSILLFSSDNLADTFFMTGVLPVMETHRNLILYEE